MRYPELSQPAPAFGGVATGSDGPVHLGPATVTVCRHGDSFTIVQVAGQLDLSNAEQFAHLISSNGVVATRVLIDFSGIDFVGSAALSALSAMARRVRRVSWSLVTAPALEHVMDASGFDRDSRCFHTVDDALAGSAG